MRRPGLQARAEGLEKMSRRSGGLKMSRVIASHEAGLGAGPFDDVQVARVLLETPIGAQRQAQEVAQQNPVDAVMADQDHALPRMMGKDVAQKVGGAHQDILERFSAGKAHQMGRGAPKGRRFPRPRLAPPRGSSTARRRNRCRSVPAGHGPRPRTGRRWPRPWQCSGRANSYRPPSAGTPGRRARPGPQPDAPRPGTGPLPCGRETAPEKCRAPARGERESRWSRQSPHNGRA